MSTEVQSDQVKSSQVQGVMTNEVQSGQVNPDWVQGLMSSEVQSGQVRSGQVRLGENEIYVSDRCKVTVSSGARCEVLGHH